jgi:hypothetical protein
VPSPVRQIHTFLPQADAGEVPEARRGSWSASASYVEEWAQFPYTISVVRPLDTPATLVMPSAGVHIPVEVVGRVAGDAIPAAAD